MIQNLLTVTPFPDAWRASWFGAFGIGPTPLLALVDLVNRIQNVRLGLVEITEPEAEFLDDLARDWWIVTELGRGLRIPGIERTVHPTAGAIAHERAAADREVVQEALRRTNGNKTKAAALLGLSRFGLIKMMKRLGLMD